MSDTVIVAIIGGVISIVILWMQQRNATKLAKLALQQETLHKQINSRMDELLQLTKEKAKAEGKVEEKAEQKDREETAK